MKLIFSAIVLSLGLSSCAQFFVKDKTYEAKGGSEINGAKVTSAVKGMGGKAGLSVSAMVYNAASGEIDGPFLWRIEARGQQGVHESLTVHSIGVRTEVTGRSEPYPSEWLGKAAPFEEMRGKENAGVVFAKFQLPGMLEVFPEKDGKITMEADISIKANGRSQRQKVSFEMNPSIGRKTETIFLPKELIQSFGKDDPTEWEWTSSSQSISSGSQPFGGPTARFQ